MHSLVVATQLQIAKTDPLAKRSKLPDDLRRITCCNHVLRNIFCDDCACPYHTVVPDTDAFAHLDPGTDEDVTAYPDSTTCDLRF